MQQELFTVQELGAAAFTPTTSLNTGVDRVLEYDNIAIVVLMVMVLFEGVLIVTLLRGLLKTKDVLFNLAQSITILNERLSHHHDDN